jgi:hypothetical protein
LILFALLSCAPEQSLHWAEQWELLVLDPGRMTLDLRITRSNSGWLKGDTSVRGAAIAKDEGTLLFGLDGRPGDVEVLQSGIRVGPDLLRGHSGGWEVQLQEGGDLGDPRNLRLNIETAGEPDNSLELQDWSVRPLELLGRTSGYLSTTGRNQLVSGKALLLHRSGTRPPSWEGEGHTTVFVSAPNISIGIDQTGGQALAWASIDGTLAWADAVLSGDFEEGWRLDFSPELPLVVEIRTRGQSHVSDPYAHLSSPEATLLQGAKGSLRRELRTGRAKIQVADQLVQGSAVVVQTRWE